MTRKELVDYENTVARHSLSLSIFQTKAPRLVVLPIRCVLYFFARDFESATEGSIERERIAGAQSKNNSRRLILREVTRDKRKVSAIECSVTVGKTD